MTVKCVTNEQKQAIGQLYMLGTSTDELGITFAVSKRTINRVLVEQGVNNYHRAAPNYKPRPVPEPVIKPEPVTEAPQQEAPLPPLTFFENLKVLLKVIFLRNNKRNDQASH